MYYCLTTIYHVMLYNYLLIIVLYTLQIYFHYSFMFSIVLYLIHMTI